MELYKSLAALIEGKALIAITGGGGKTTLMENLGEYLKNEGYSVLITTTTKVASPVFHDYKVDFVYSDSSVFSHAAKKGESVFYASRSYDSKKWMSPELSEIEILSQLYDVVIYEADGSRGLPLKYHNWRDPVVLPSTDIVIGVMGMWGIGYKAYEMCFGDGSDTIIDTSYLNEYIRSEEGLKKGMDYSDVKMFLFNGAESATEEQMKALKAITMPAGFTGYIASEKENILYETL